MSVREDGPWGSSFVMTKSGVYTGIPCLSGKMDLGAALYTPPQLCYNKISRIYWNTMSVREDGPWGSSFVMTKSGVYSRISCPTGKMDLGAAHYTPCNFVITKVRGLCWNTTCVQLCPQDEMLVRHCGAESHVKKMGFILPFSPLSPPLLTVPPSSKRYDYGAWSVQVRIPPATRLHHCLLHPHLTLLLLFLFFSSFSSSCSFHFFTVFSEKAAQANGLLCFFCFPLSSSFFFNCSCSLFLFNLLGNSAKLVC